MKAGRWGAMSAGKAAGNGDFRGPLDVTRAATIVLDSRGTVIGWSPAAQRLLGYRPHEIIGQPLSTFLKPRRPSPGRTRAVDRSAGPTVSPLEEGDECVAVHRDGHRLLLVTAVCPLSDAGVAERVLVAAEREGLIEWESQLAMLHGLATQSPVGLAHP